MRDDVLSFSRDRQSGFMVISVSVPRWPQLAADLANFVAARLDDYLQTASRSRAGRQRVFLEERLEGSLMELKAATENLADFERENRAYESSPSSAYDPGAANIYAYAANDFSDDYLPLFLGTSPEKEDFNSRTIGARIAVSISLSAVIAYIDYLIERGGDETSP